MQKTAHPIGIPYASTTLTTSRPIHLVSEPISVGKTLGWAQSKPNALFVKKNEGIWNSKMLEVGAGSN